MHKPYLAKVTTSKDIMVRLAKGSIYRIFF